MTGKCASPHVRELYTSFMIRKQRQEFRDVRVRKGKLKKKKREKLIGKQHAIPGKNIKKDSVLIMSTRYGQEGRALNSWIPLRRKFKISPFEGRT